MGYYTHYNLKMEPNTTEAWMAVRQNEEAALALDENGDPQERTKWYEHEKDLKALSKQFPGVLFTLRGEGEESEDLWAKYFMDGKMQVAKAEIKIEPFSARKLI